LALKNFKVSDYVIEFFIAQGVGHIFLVSGGASIHLLHSANKINGMLPIPTHHEQGAAMAADGYARSTGFFGLAVATSGPGATNLLTGIAGAWFDSIPCIFITGQVATFRMKGVMGVRQLGFQETDIVDMSRPITKLAVQIESTEKVPEILAKSLGTAFAGRPGPVLIDIPDDIQRSYALFETPKKIDVLLKNEINTLNKGAFRELEKLLRGSKRPILVLGSGANLRITRKLSQKLVDTLNLPVLTTWGAKDLINNNNPKLVGTFGSHGTRYGNFAIQNSDLVIVLGSRLSSRETGGDLSTWAREARLVHVDIDQNESKKLKILGKEPNLTISVALENFIPDLIEYASKNLLDCNYQEWLEWIKVRKIKFSYQVSNDKNKINGYDFFLLLNGFLGQDDQIFLDTGCTVAWAMQSLNLPEGARIYHDNNNTAMGWALPAAIGGALSNPEKLTTSISGDGSFMMNIQELATAIRYSPKLKIIVLNNLGYGMVRQTEEQWLDGLYVGTDSRNGDLLFPNFQLLAKSFGFEVGYASTHEELMSQLKALYSDNSIRFLEVRIDPDSKVIPQTRYGYPLEDSDPILSRDELKANMIIPIIKD
jgi:acetolactate synthase-1/2/3 large subunit